MDQRRGLSLGVLAIVLVSILPLTHSIFLDGKKLPQDFVYGCAVAAFQVEGAWNESGKGVSVWDNYCHKGLCALNSTGDVTDDFYHSYKTDLPLFKSVLGVNSFSTSLAWTRFMPSGRSPLNQKGIQFYKNMLDTVKSNGMKASCTLFHWDLPQALFDEYKGMASSKFVRDFRNYAIAAFKALGNRCDYWITFNEPHATCTGYGPNPGTAPGVNGPAKEFYDCGHNLLLAHASAVEAYRATGLKAPIGIKLEGSPAVPFDPTSPSDQRAAKVANDFLIGWFVNPITRGDYPETMRKSMGSMLNTFTKKQSESLMKSTDFMGLDPYTSFWSNEQPKCEVGSPTWPSCVTPVSQFQIAPNGTTIGMPTGTSWNYLTPYNSIVGTLKMMKETYNATFPFWISETGMSRKNEPYLSIAEKINDTESRVRWYRETLKAVKQAIDLGYNLKGFVPWSCMDNLEWSSGFTQRFGVIGVGYDAAGKGSQSRFVKNSAKYLKSVFINGSPLE
eukprot:TRINITY_DN663_c0_g1_i1.p1 TRINITY_DN663_c0_g1~~TRINITY_DN663_c0_g1_i1.p1  ORF type:complete len:503 (-),score=139.78 TRINITY_DN663_c0_g1_i1:204-1712(-)